MFPGGEEGQSREAYMCQNLMLSVKYGALVLAALAVVRGGYTVISEKCNGVKQCERERTAYLLCGDRRKEDCAFL